MALKNTYTKSTLDNIVNTIQKTLIAHGAKKIMFNYSDTGEPVGLTFGITVEGKLLGVKLPARVEECRVVLEREGLLNPNKERYALRVAWANIRDLIDVKMAIIDIGMGKMEEVFLPYILEGNKTVYEIYAPRFNTLPEGKV